MPQYHHAKTNEMIKQPLYTIKQNQKPDLLVNHIAKRKTRQHKKVLIETTTSNYLTIEKLTVRKKKRIQD